MDRRLGHVDADLRAGCEITACGINQAIAEQYLVDPAGQLGGAPTLVAPTEQKCRSDVCSRWQA